MKKNIGTTDMIIRIIIGIVIASVGIIYKSWWGLIALIPLLTAIFRICPLYPAIGIATNSKEKV